MLAGTLTQNDMQVVRMWIGGSDFRELDQLQPLPTGMPYSQLLSAFRYLLCNKAHVKIYSNVPVCECT